MLQLNATQVSQQFQSNPLVWPSLSDIANVTSYTVEPAVEQLSEATPPASMIPTFDGDDPPVLRSPQSSGQPSECLQGYKNIERTVSCSRLNFTVTSYETRNNVKRQTGKVWVTTDNWARFNRTTNFGASPAWELGTRVTTTNAEGRLETNPTNFIFSTSCESSSLCDTVDESANNAGNHPLVEGQTVEGIWNQVATGPVTTATTDTVDQMKGAIGAKLLHGPTPNPWSIELNKLEGRCDNIVTQIGCVNDKALAGMAFNAQTHPLITEVAQHIYDAQASLPSHWGVYGVPLSRLTDDDMITDNRNTACPSSSAPPAPLQCDEYPFATTYQGAALVAPGDYSTRSVHESSNQSQGGIILSNYNRHRIIDGDQYVVLAVLANGLTSW